MIKKLTRVFILFVLISMFIFMLVACDFFSFDSDDGDDVDTVNSNSAKCIVTFNSNGGSAVSSIKVESGSTITKPTDPTKSGFNFEGWYKNSDLTTSWDFSTYKITNTTTLYAKWKEKVMTGSGSERDPYVFYTPKQLQSLTHAYGMNYTNYYFALGEDIDLKNLEWEPIGDLNTPFKANFDGRGYTVKNIKITSNNIKYAGLFGWNEGKIKNLYVENLTVSTTAESSFSHVGGIAGWNFGAVDNCSMRGTLNYSSTDGIMCEIGGIAGTNLADIMNCFSTADIKATSSSIYAGGLVGNQSNGVIFTSFATSNITISVNSPSWAGGLVGSGTSTCLIDCCFATGNISVTDSREPYFGEIGGITGNDDTRLSNCYRYDSQIFRRKEGYNATHSTPTNNLGSMCTTANLNNALFYTNTLNFWPYDWDFSNLDFANGKYPTLKAA